MSDTSLKDTKQSQEQDFNKVFDGGETNELANMLDGTFEGVSAPEFALEENIAGNKELRSHAGLPVFRIALIGKKSSGKSCFLGSLLVNCISSPANVDATWIDEPSDDLARRAGWDEKKKEEAKAGTEWLNDVQQDMLRGKFPQSTPVFQSAYRSLFLITSPDVQCYVEIVDYSGEYLERKKGAGNDKAMVEEVRKILADSDGAIVLAEIPMPGEETAISDELQDFKNALAKITAMKSTAKINRAPFVLAVNKWDRHSEIDFVDQTAEFNKLEAFLNPLPPAEPPFHRKLFDLLSSLGSTTAFQAFPVSVFGKSSSKKVTIDGKLKRKETVDWERPLKALNIVEPIVWLVRQQQRIGAERFQKQSAHHAALAPWRIVFAPSLISEASKQKKRSEGNSATLRAVKKASRSVYISSAVQSLIVLTCLSLIPPLSTTTTDMLKLREIDVAIGGKSSPNDYEIRSMRAWLKDYQIPTSYSRVVSHFIYPPDSAFIGAYFSDLDNANLLNKSRREIDAYVTAVERWVRRTKTEIKYTTKRLVLSKAPDLSQMPVLPKAVPERLIRGPYGKKMHAANEQALTFVNELKDAVDRGRIEAYLRIANRLILALKDYGDRARKQIEAGRMPDAPSRDIASAPIIPRDLRVNVKKEEQTKLALEKNEWIAKFYDDRVPSLKQEGKYAVWFANGVKKLDKYTQLLNDPEAGTVDALMKAIGDIKRAQELPRLRRPELLPKTIEISAQKHIANLQKLIKKIEIDLPEKGLRESLARADKLFTQGKIAEGLQLVMSLQKQAPLVVSWRKDLPQRLSLDAQNHTQRLLSAPNPNFNQVNGYLDQFVTRTIYDEALGASGVQILRKKISDLKASVATDYDGYSYRQLRTTWQSWVIGQPINEVSHLAERYLAIGANPNMAKEVRNLQAFLSGYSNGVRARLKFNSVRLNVSNVCGGRYTISIFVNGNKVISTSTYLQQFNRTMNISRDINLPTLERTRIAVDVEFPEGVLCSKFGSGERKDIDINTAKGGFSVKTSGISAVAQFGMDIHLQKPELPLWR